MAESLKPMEKITAQHPLSHSTDIVKENLETLKRLFPTIVKEGKIDVDELKALLDEEIETNEEYYRFSWAGKSAARRESNKPSTATLRPNKVDSKNWDTTGNIFIEGDNLEVLKLLQKSYAGKIKMMYFDPPYNTGKDFVYKDNYSDNLGNYLAITGQTDNEGKKFNTNAESDGRYHSNWLNMMYPRLKLAYNLLTEDGVVFISIDDNEVFNLHKLCDEIFGEENFIAQIIWERAYSPINLKKHFSVSHDYLLCYSNSINSTDCNGLVRSIESIGRYLNPDSDSRGVWQSDNLSVGPAISTKIYPIVTPGGREVFPPNGRCWVYTKDRLSEMIKDNRIYFGPEGNNVPRVKRFLSEVKNSVTPMSIWKYSEVGHSQDSAQDLKKLFDDKDFFDYPKPVNLIKRCIELYANANSLILDFFAGSGTTAHAVMLKNAEDGGNRNFICVQIPEPIAEDSEAYNAGYSNIAGICKERIRRAGSKIINDKTVELEILKKSIESKILQEDTQEQIDTMQTTINNLDTGFKAFKLDSSNIQAWDGSVENFEQNIFNAENNIKENRSEEDVLFEILLKYGLDLNVAIEEKKVDACNVYSIGEGVLFVCLSDNITIAVAEAIGKWKEELQPVTCRALFKDNGFKDDIAKTNSIQILRQYGIEEANSI